MDFDYGLIGKLRHAGRIVAFTGAGVSAESGIPTFRDAQTGLWARFRAEELVTPEAFRRNPETVWKWYEWRRNLMSGVQPNPAHIAIRQLEQLVNHVTVITQNIDGLHALAGSSEVIELHDNIWSNFCSNCGRMEDSSRKPRASRYIFLHWHLQPG